jgi:hypothetical protein
MTVDSNQPATPGSGSADVLLRDATGALYLVPAAQASRYVLPGDEARRLLELAERARAELGVEDLQGVASKVKELSLRALSPPLRAELAGSRVSQIRGGLLPNLPILIQIIWDESDLPHGSEK